MHVKFRQFNITVIHFIVSLQDIVQNISDYVSEFLMIRDFGEVKFDDIAKYFLHMLRVVKMTLSSLG